MKGEICKTKLSGLRCTRSRKQSEGLHLQQSFFFLWERFRKKRSLPKCAMS